MRKAITSRAGMTMVELLMVMGITGILSSIAIGRYVTVRCKAKVDTQLTVIQGIKNKIDLTRSLNGSLPASNVAFPPGSEEAKLITSTVTYVPDIPNYKYVIYFNEDSCLIAGQKAGANETEDAAKLAVWP